MNECFVYICKITLQHFKENRANFQKQINLTWMEIFNTFPRIFELIDIKIGHFLPTIPWQEKYVPTNWLVDNGVSKKTTDGRAWPSSRIKRKWAWNFRKRRFFQINLSKINICNNLFSFCAAPWFFSFKSFDEIDKNWSRNKVFYWA